MDDDFWQPTRHSKICFIGSFKLAVRVSGDSFAHLQEHFYCIYSFLEQCTDTAVCCRPVTQVRSNLCHFTGNAMSHKRQDLNGLVRFARKTKSGFCAFAITFQQSSTTQNSDTLGRNVHVNVAL